MSQIARLKPVASQLLAVVSELRRSLGDADAIPALEEASELCLMLWLDLDEADRDAARSGVS